MALSEVTPGEDNRLTFDKWLEQEWIPAEGVPDWRMRRIARYAWTSGYRQRDSDHKRAMAMVDDWWNE